MTDHDVLSPADERLLELAMAIADGAPIDWSTASHSASAPSQPPVVSSGSSPGDLEVSPVVARLQHLERLVRGHEAVRSRARGNTAPAGETLLSEARRKGNLPVGGPLEVQWGPLIVHQKIGRGSFGDVYRAWDPRLDREVALKLVPEDASESTTSPVVEEGRLLARVRHPNVLTVHGAERIDGRVGIWTEYVHGETLADEVARRGPLSAEEAARIGIDVCAALSAVHAAGLLHRDVKAQNIMRDGTGRIVLGDFGTGVEFGEDVGVSEPQVAGTPLYLAPEVIAHEAASVGSDLYSVGVLLYFLVTGNYPTRGRTFAEIKRAHASGQHVPLRQAKPDLSNAFVIVVEGLLAAGPDRRYGTASAAEAALGSVLTSGGASTRRAFRVGQALAASAAIVAAASIGVAWWTANRNRNDGRKPSGTPAATTGIPLSAAGTRNLRQISREPDLSGPGAPSPDGQLLSYSNWSTGDLAIHEIATGNHWLVTSNGPSDAPGWGWVETSRFTTDGSALFYVWYQKRDNHQYGEIRWIAARGGASRTIWRAPVDAYVYLQHWAGDDGLILVGVYERTGSHLVVISPAEGRIRHTIATGVQLPYGASLSPDARHVALDRQDPATGSRDVFVVSVDGQLENIVVLDPASDHTPVWTKDGRHLMFLSDRSGPTGLWCQRVDGARPVGTARRIEPNLGWSFFMGLTDDGTYFVRRQMGVRDVYLANLDPATAVVTGEPSRASIGVAGANGNPAWSPDGNRLAFFRRRDDRRSLVIKSLDVGRERELVNHDIDYVAKPRWESGGHSVLIKGNYRHQGGIYRVDLDTEKVSTLMLEDDVNDYELLPDGNSIIYASRTRREFVRRDLVNGTETILLRVDAPWNPYGLAVSRFGERFAYVGTRKGAGTSLFVMDLNASRGPREVFHVGPEEGIVAYVFTADGREVVISRSKSVGAPEPDVTTLWAVDVQSGASRLLGLNVNIINDVRLSPDGRHVAYDGGAPLQEVWVLENALSGLE